MTLQHVVLKLEEETEEASILDAFVRVGDDDLRGCVMDRSIPSRTIILSTCIVPVSEREKKHGKIIMCTQVIEFSKEIQIDHVQHDPSGILVMYKWEWCNQVDSEQDRLSDTTWSMISTFSHTPDS